MTASPLAIFDSRQNINISPCYNYLQDAYHKPDIVIARSFLAGYTGSQGTFNSYRREIERLIHWAALVQHKTLAQLKRVDIEAFMKFSQSPPASWIGESKPARFIEKEGERLPNSKWRPFIATVSKYARRQGETACKGSFELSSGSIREVFAILSSFFNYLVQEEYATMNPVSVIRQKSKYIRKSHTQSKVRRLSELQWQTVIKVATQLAEDDPTHERTLFIMSSLYGMYLRISELCANERWQPMMHHFHRDSDGNWWFTTVGKGNKQRQIAVSNAMLEALKRWRSCLNLPALPTQADSSPLIPKIKGSGGLRSVNQVRRIVQYCFDQAIAQLHKENFTEEAQALNEATVHWLRHTGISDDVKTRPREHVRDDAGHSSSLTTDRYIDVELQERHRTAKHKTIED